MDIYLDASRLGIYPPLFTSPSGDSCILLYIFVLQEILSLITQNFFQILIAMLFLQMTLESWVMQFVSPQCNKTTLTILIMTTCLSYIYVFLAWYKSWTSSKRNLIRWKKKTITVELLELLVFLQAIFAALSATWHSLFPFIVKFNLETSWQMMSFWDMEYVPYFKTTLKIIWDNHTVNSNEKICVRHYK